MILSVDLAAKFSAACLQSKVGQIHRQYDSRQVSPGFFLSLLEQNAQEADILVVEDLPHALRFDSTTKAVARLQGRLIERFSHHGDCLDKLWFIPPALWQRHFHGVWRGGPKGAAAAAEALGYSPPNLLVEFLDDFTDLHGPERQKVRASLQKIMTDYVDAFLLGRWTADMLAEHGTLAKVKSAQKYT